MSLRQASRAPAVRVAHPPMVAGCLAIVFAAALPALAQEITPGLFAQLQYRSIGPPGNRTSAVVGVPGDPLVYYIGASSGGIWKSTDGGIHWQPIFDDQGAQSIGALAIAPSDPNVIWAGTGEAFIRSNVSIGNGVYRSTDAGKTWQHMGLEPTGRIGRIVIDPRDPNIVMVAALGHCYGPQKERGVFRTTDGGKTWQHVLFVDENTGCFEIAMNPANPRILFAGMWPLVIRTWGRESGGPGGGIYMSRDNGETWKRLEGHGLPDPPLGKIGLAIARSNPEVVYALIETGAPNRGVLWRSGDGGGHWKLVSYDRILNERPHYASRVLVNPADENEVYFAANSHSISHDGGETTERTGWSGDTHDMWADPLMPDRLMLSDDGGAVISLNRGRSWHRVVLPVAQMYHVSVDNRIPYYVYGGRQDGSGYRGPNTARGGGGELPEWEETAGGECGFIVPDPVDPDIVWGGSYNAGFTRVNYRTGHERSVMVWPESAYGSSAGLLEYRFNWTFPITISPHDHNVVYAGSQFVHRTCDGGASWEVISPDLSTNDQSKMGPSGGLTKDNIGVEYGCVVFAIAESPLEAGEIWAGTNDGLLWVTRDGGAHWSDLTANLPDLAEWGTISNIEPSRHDKQICYVTVDFHQMNDRDPFVYETKDDGATWHRIDGGVPRSVFSYAHWIHEDPKRPGMLYLGTENAIYVSFDDGEHWLPLQNNLPHAPVHHMVVQESFNDLVVATYGRGFWIMDDITPLQELTAEVLSRDVHLFSLRPAYRFHPIKGGPRVRPTAYINYYLAKKPEGAVSIEILDESGKTVRKLDGTKHTGINRVTWNLRCKGAKPAKLRTRPPGNPHVVEEKRFREKWQGEGWYPILSWGAGAGFRGILVAPGRYTVRLTMDGKTVEGQLEIRKDPRSQGTLDDIDEQISLQLAIREDLDAVSDMLGETEWMKRQIIDARAAWKARWTAHGVDKPVADAADKLIEKLQAFEDEIFQKVQAEGDSKSFRYPNLLYSKLSYLAGDVATLADFAPNAQQKRVFDILHQRVAGHRAELERIVSSDVAGFNAVLRENGLGGVVSSLDASD